LFNAFRGFVFAFGLAPEGFCKNNLIIRVIFMNFDFEFWLDIFLVILSLVFSIASILLVLSVHNKFEKFRQSGFSFAFFGSIYSFLFAAICYFAAYFNGMFEYPFYVFFVLTGFFLVGLAFKMIDFFELRSRDVKKG